MKKNIRNRIIGTVLAAVCAFSAAAAVTTVGASAATVDTAASVSASYGKRCRLDLRGWNWTYSADSYNALISCDFDYCTQRCTFIATGNEPGVTNAVLKTLRDDGRWNNVPVRFTVDDYLNVTGKVTGRTFITAD